MFDFSDQVVLIKGAAGSLGQTTARRLLKAGSRVVLVDNRRDRLAQIYADIIDTVDCMAPAVDITRSESVAVMVAKTLEHLERIDVLINTAEGFRMGTPAHETTTEEWDSLLDLNPRSVFLTARAVIPHMLRQGHGKIVNIEARAAVPVYGRS